MKKTVTYMILAFALFGCTTFPSEATKFSEQTVSNLDIHQTEIISQTKGLFGVTSLDSKVADLHPAYLIQTSSNVYFVAWNADTKQFVKEVSLPINHIETVSFIHYGNFGHLRQIHITSEVGLIALSFTIGENETAENAYKKLIDSGAKVGSRTKFVRDVGDANMVIPIFIPVR